MKRLYRDYESRLKSLFGTMPFETFWEKVKVIGIPEQHDLSDINDVVLNQLPRKEEFATFWRIHHILGNILIYHLFNRWRAGALEKYLGHLSDDEFRDLGPSVIAQGQEYYESIFEDLANLSSIKGRKWEGLRILNGLCGQEVEAEVVV